MKTASGLLLIIFFCGACSSSSTFEGECKRDADCEDQYQRCDTRDYRCVCASDEACAAGEFCNASGSCQRKMACFSNLDCDSGSICDIDSGECISSTSCTTDFHCDLGAICQSGTCQAGCHSSADCDLGNFEICVDSTCRFGLCENNNYCEFGRVCNIQTHTCEQPTEPHCTSGCSATCEDCALYEGPCGDPANVCVRKDLETHCWVECQTEDECPSGYQCVPTTVAWSPICDSDTDCTENPNPDDRVINICDGKGSATPRCRLNKQVCEEDADCHQFTTTCFASQCVFAKHCRPQGGCP
jgi:hypothetical protein